MLPLKTTFDDINALSNYLKTQVGWVELDKVKKTIDPVYADNRKIESMRYVGLLDRDGTNVKLSELGRKYASASDDAEKANVFRSHLGAIALYQSTLEWIHFQHNLTPTRTEVANYWHDNHSSLIEGATGSALTDGAIFFLRVAEAAGLGKFMRAGGGHPETYLKVDETLLTKYVTNTGDAAPTPHEAQIPPNSSQQTPPKQQSQTPTVQVTASPGVHINIEIHVAADAKPSTVEEIFKNMRKYVLDIPGDDDGR